MTMQKIGRDFLRKPQHLDSRKRTMSENDSTYGEERISSKEWTLDDGEKNRTLCNEKVNMTDGAVIDSDEETFRELIRRHSEDGNDTKIGVQRPRVMKPQRPMLERKSHSDLTTYCNTKIKILVEGKELSTTDTQGKYSSEWFNSSLQEPSINADRVAAETQREQNDKRKIRSFVGWFGKTHAKTYHLKNGDKISEEMPGTKSPGLRRSRSFSGRIRDKIKTSFNSTNSKQPEVFPPQKPNSLQPPSMFYRNNQDLNRLNRGGITQFGYQRRHSDQTDSMLRRPLGGKRDDKTSTTYYSLDRGLRQISSSAKKPLTRKRSNSLENQDDFPFWSEISDADRSRSCAARIGIKEQQDTHRDNDGMLETNLCSTEL